MRECPCTSASLAEHSLWEINPNLSSMSLWSHGGDGHIHVSIKGSERIGAEEGARAQGGGSTDPPWVWASSPGRRTPGPRVSTWEALDSRRQ